MTHLFITECRRCGTELGYMDHCCPNPRCPSAPSSAPIKLLPYHANPQRRLRRIKRWMVTCGGTPDPECVHQFNGESGFESWEDRVSLARDLMSAELEWACKTAMTAVGGTWE